mgnify:CR=1 FL=1
MEVDASTLGLGVGILAFLMDLFLRESNCHVSITGYEYDLYLQCSSLLVVE